MEWKKTIRELVTEDRRVLRTDLTECGEMGWCVGCGGGGVGGGGWGGGWGGVGLNYCRRRHSRTDPMEWKEA